MRSLRRRCRFAFCWRAARLWCRRWADVDAGGEEGLGVILLLIVRGLDVHERWFPGRAVFEREGPGGDAVGTSLGAAALIDRVFGDEIYGEAGRGTWRRQHGRILDAGDGVDGNGVAGAGGVVRRPGADGEGREGGGGRAVGGVRRVEAVDVAGASARQRARRGRRRGAGRE